MKYNELKISSHKKSYRSGRGISAGRGKTGGRGTKGQNSRTGSSRKPGFEGGQNPLMQRMPKLRGFRSFKTATNYIKTGDLNGLKVVNIDNHTLFDARLVDSPHSKVKLIAGGELAKKLSVKLQSASKGAVELLQKKGGVFTITPQIARQPKPSKSKSENNTA